MTLSMKTVRLIHHPIAIGIHELHDAADGIELARGMFVLHVGAPFAHVERAIAVERHGRGFLDHRLARDADELVSLRHLDGLDGVGGLQARDNSYRDSIRPRRERSR